MSGGTPSKISSKVYMTTLKIKRIPTTPIVDVFQDEGWESWTRLLWKGSVLIPLQGEVLTKGQLEEVKKELIASQPKRN